MFVSLLCVDDWKDRVDYGTRVDNPDWADVEHAVRRLDGERRTMMSIADSEEGDALMIVAGPWNGRFLVNATTDGQEFFTLIDPSGTQRMITLFVGGQNGDYEERKFVCYREAIEALREFFEHGTLKTSLNWENDYVA